MTYRVLIFGASYGSLLGVKLALAGHSVRLVCLPREAELINRAGVIVRMPIKGHAEPIDISSNGLAGELSAASPSEVQEELDFDYDLAALAMQEPQYSSPSVRELLGKVARTKVPCMSIMNMPPLTYLRRLPGIDTDACRDCYSEPGLWSEFDDSLMTACSPDPQVFRPSPERPNLLQVRLPTNFKVAPFESSRSTSILRRLAGDIQAIRLQGSVGMSDVPVKLRVSDSIFVPLAKWPMLIAGNYRCVQRNTVPLTIRDAVHTELGDTREVYDWVGRVCQAVGAQADDLVPFDKYAHAALSLTSPSSAARALASGARAIERVDRLVQSIAEQKGMQNDRLDEVVRLVDAQLSANRAPGKAVAAH